MAKQIPHLDSLASSIGNNFIVTDNVNNNEIFPDYFKSVYFFISLRLRSFIYFAVRLPQYALGVIFKGNELNN